MTRMIRPLFKRWLRHGVRFALLALVVVMVAGAPLQVTANDPARSARQDLSQTGVNQAGLVIRYADGDVERVCVSFSEPTLLGDELIALAGIDVGLATDGRVCSIDGVGCDANDCWCQCTDFNNCTYWAYYHLVNGSWEYSNEGATNYDEVTNGSVEGWSWGTGNFVSAIEPPVYTFEQICAPGAQESPTPTPTATATLQLAVATPPQIAFFQASPSVVTAGGCTTLQWGVSGADEVRVDGGVVAPQGQQRVCPAASRNYTLVATNAAGSSSREASVQVQTASTPAAGATATSLPRATAPALPTAPRPVLTPTSGAVVAAGVPPTAGPGVLSTDPAPLGLPTVDAGATVFVAPPPPPAPTRTPYRFALPPTSTPRPRTLLGAHGRPTPTPILVAVAGSAAVGKPPAGQPAARLPRGNANSPAAAASARGFRAALLPGYAAFLFMLASLAVMAVWVMRRRMRPVKVDGGTGARRSGDPEL